MLRTSHARLLTLLNKTQWNNEFNIRAACVWEVRVRVVTSPEFERQKEGRAAETG